MKKVNEMSLVLVDRESYNAGDMSNARVVNCNLSDDYDAISDCWDSIDVDDIIIRGLGVNERVMHLAEVTDDTRTIEGVNDLIAPFFVSYYSVEEGDGDVDQWEFFAADGRRLTAEEAWA